MNNATQTTSANQNTQTNERIPTLKELKKSKSFKFKKPITQKFELTNNPQFLSKQNLKFLAIVKAVNVEKCLAYSWSTFDPEKLQLLSDDSQKAPKQTCLDLLLKDACLWGKGMFRSLKTKNSVFMTPVCSKQNWTVEKTSKIIPNSNHCKPN